MKLTNKGRYAVMAMAELAKHDIKKPINLSEISIRQGISISFLGQIFLKLKNKDLVQRSRRANVTKIQKKDATENLLNVSHMIFGRSSSIISCIFLRKIH